MASTSRCKRTMEFYILNLIKIFIVLQIFQLGSCLAAKSIKQKLHKSTADSVGKLGQPVTSHYVTMEVGTPPKEFRMLVDVNARDVWLPHYLKLGIIYPRLNYKDGYSKKASNSSVKEEDKEFKIDYQGTELEGKIYRDTFQLQNGTVLGPMRPANYTQRFLAISSANNLDFKRYPNVDGVFAMSQSLVSETGSVLPILAMNHASLIDEVKFSIKFDQDLNSNQSGEITFGPEEGNQYQDRYLRYHLTVSQVKWEINLQNVLLGSESMSCVNAQCTATISTSDQDIYGPAKDVARIIKALSLIEKESDFNEKKLYEIPCLKVASVPTLTFAIDGLRYTMNGLNYIRPKVDGIFSKSTTCYVAILANSGAPNSWTLGTGFLVDYYTVFDAAKRQIAFGSR